MLKVNGKGLLIVVSGPSGAGKDTICKRIVDDLDNIWISISATSRNPRVGEVEGKDYFFMTKEEFEDKIKDNLFLEYATYNGNYYGTPKDKIEDYLNSGIDVILVIDIQGAINVKKLVPSAVCIFVMPPSMKILKQRLIDRKTEDRDKIIERFKTAYNEINHFQKYNYVVVNDEVDVCANKVKAIIQAEKCRVDRIEEIHLDNKEEIIHELLIDKNFDNDDIKFE